MDQLEVTAFLESAKSVVESLAAKGNWQKVRDIGFVAMQVERLVKSLVSSSDVGGDAVEQ